MIEVADLLCATHEEAEADDGGFKDEVVAGVFEGVATIEDLEAAAVEGADGLGGEACTKDGDAGDLAACFAVDVAFAVGLEFVPDDLGACAAEVCGGEVALAEEAVLFYAEGVKGDADGIGGVLGGGDGALIGGELDDDAEEAVVWVPGAGGDFGFPGMDE